MIWERGTKRKKEDRKKEKRREKKKEKQKKIFFSSFFEFTLMRRQILGFWRARLWKKDTGHVDIFWLYLYNNNDNYYNTHTIIIAYPTFVFYYNMYTGNQ